MRVLVIALLSGSALLAAGCGANCQDACNRIYAPSECDIKVPGMSWESMYRDCVDDCEEALSNPGELNGYDPEERHTSGDSIELKTDKQAAVWMDCVVETACEDLTRGYCAPL